MMGSKSLHDGFLSKISYINKVTGNGRRCSHCGADQMRAPALALAAFEVAGRGRCTALARLKAVSIQGQAHGTPRLAPFEAGSQADFGRTFLPGLLLDQPAPRRDPRRLD